MRPAATKLRTVVLDFDGVVVESVDVKTEAFRMLFADHPDQVDRIVRLHLDNLGMSRYEKFEIVYRDFLRKPLDDAEVVRLDRRFSELVFERVVACDFVAGAPEFLERISVDHRLHVASATPQEELSRIVDARGLSQFFASVRGSPQTKAQIVGEVLSTEGIGPCEALVVGDALTDYRGAATNGVPFVGRVPEGGSDPFESLDVDTVRDLAELDRRWEEIQTGLGIR